MPRVPDKQLGVFEIIDAAFDVYEEHLVKMIKIVAPLVVPAYVLQAVILSLVAPEYRSFDSYASFEEFFQDQGAFVVTQVLTGIAVIVLVMVANAGCIRLVSDAFDGRELEAGAARDAGGESIGALLVASFLGGLLTLVGFMFLILPGIYLAGAMLLIVPAVMVERLSGYRAVRRSVALIRGNWWRAIAPFLIVSIAVGVAAAVVSIPALFVDPNTPVAFALGATGSIVVGLFLYPMSAIVATIIFYDLRLRKEGPADLAIAQTVPAQPGWPDPGTATGSSQPVRGFAPPVAEPARLQPPPLSNS